MMLLQLLLDVRGLGFEVGLSTAEFHPAWHIYMSNFHKPTQPVVEAV